MTKTNFAGPTTYKTRMIVDNSIRSNEAYWDYLEYSGGTNLLDFHYSIPIKISHVIDNDILQILIRDAKYSLNVSAKNTSNILDSIQNLSNEINTKTSHEANFLVVSPAVHTILDTNTTPLIHCQLL